MDFPEGWSKAQIELSCMTHDHPISSGGLGRHGHLKRAMILLWPHLYFGEVEEGVPKWRDEIELLTWAWANHKFVSVIGHASAAKTHTFGHIVAAEYLADMPNTIATLTSTHLNGLRKRLWSDTVAALTSSTAGQVFDIRHHDMLIRPIGSKEEKYCIEGIATDRGQDAVEKIQGTHSRLNRFVVIDEAQGTPTAIFDAAANLMTDPNFRMAMLANPTKKYSELGSWCEPTGGWNKVDPDLDVQWETKRGGVCVRLDGARSPNIKYGRTVFPFLIRQDFVEGIEKSFGKGSPRWWTFYRGWFAPDGSLGLVVPPSALSRGDQKHVYSLPPVKIASLDPAFEGGDQCILSIGEHGPDFKMNLVKQIPVKVAVSEKSDPMDYMIAQEAIRICKEEGVLTADDLIVDTTGAGRGVAAFIDMNWGKCRRCGFGGSPTTRKMKANESETGEDLFDRFVSELWWAVRVYLETGMVGGVSASNRELCEDLSAREYETAKEKKISVEKKTEMKSRLGRSPDHGDSFAMLIELMRRKGALAGRDDVPVGGTVANKHKARAVHYSKLANYEKEFSHHGYT
jgi:hypothetical protein